MCYPKSKFILLKPTDYKSRIKLGKSKQVHTNLKVSTTKREACKVNLHKSNLKIKGGSNDFSCPTEQEK